MSAGPITPRQFHRQRWSLGDSKGGPTSPFGVSFFQAPPGFFLHEQKEMGWIEPALVTHCGVCPRVDVGARAASGGDKVLWECIDPYEAEVRNHATSSDTADAVPPSPRVRTGARHCAAAQSAAAPYLLPRSSFSRRNHFVGLRRRCAGGRNAPSQGFPLWGKLSAQPTDEGNAATHATSSDRPSGGHLPLKGKA